MVYFHVKKLGTLNPAQVEKGNTTYKNWNKWDQTTNSRKH